jgi:hypothetical protein
MKHTVNVWGKLYEVSIRQKSKSVWEAVGTYDRVANRPGVTSREIRVTGRTESAALKRWIEAARYAGN